MIKLIVGNQIKISKKSLSGAQLRKLRVICTVKNPEYYNSLTFKGWVDPDTPEYFTAYEENDRYILIPRGALDKAVDLLGDVSIIYKTSSYDSISLSFQVDMEARNYQDAAVESLLMYDSGILVAPTGSGKTNIMVKLIQKIDEPTLILVHRDHLLKQWQERIQRFLGYSVGIIGEGTWKVRNITIAMIPTLHVHNDRMKELQKRFGLVIIDECHHIPAFTWLSRVIQLGANRIYGCSATPKRKDGLQKLMYLAIGPVRHVLQDRVAVEAGAITTVKVKVIRTNYAGWLINSQAAFTKMMPDLIVNKDRNSLIVKHILAEKDHTQIVLSDRIQHLKILYDMLKNRPGIEPRLVIGQTTTNQRSEIFGEVLLGKVNVILASSVADEGLDIPILDRLHLVFPTSNPERNMQQIGRIRRPAPGKTDAIVYDYFDWQNPTMNRQFRARKSKYRSNNFEIEFIGDIYGSAA